MKSSRYRVLVLARSYPNNLLPELGLWVRHLVHQCSSFCELKVISPVPYFPSIKGFERYSRFRKIIGHSFENGIEVYHPPFLVGPGRSLYISEALSYYLGIRSTVDKIHRDFDFNLIHAHFTYPDGIVAARLGLHYRVPVVITEHGLWRPNGIEKQRLVLWQAIWAARKCAYIIAVSNSVRDSIIHFTDQPEKVRVIPIGVDGSIFTARQNGDLTNKNQVLYVGFINFNKGIDLLLKAFDRVIKRRPNTKLVLVGGGFYNDTMKQEKQLRSMAEDIGLDRHVEFAGIKSPAEVAKYMKESALLVLPSRAESFGAVLVEALACGTPVVATKCGGPEDIVNDKVGILVTKEDDNALALAINQVLDNGHHYNPAQLRAYSLEKFAWERIAHRVIDLYSKALDCF